MLVVVFGAIFGGKYYMDHKATGGQSHFSVSVATALAQGASWDARVRAIGTLRAFNGTAITAQIAGNVTEIAFASGERVEKGDLLVQLDNSSQLAALHADQAKLKLARADLKRAQNLVKSHAISEEQLQTAQMNRTVAAAAVESDRATLGKLRITAPFDGVLGIREVSLGQYVSPGTPVVTVQQWQPMLLDFSLPQEALSRIEVGQKVVFTTNAWPDRSFTGQITAIAARVEPETRMLDVQAKLGNADGALRPGLFGHVTLELGKAMTGIVVPQTAIGYSTFGDRVYVVVDGKHGGQIAQARLVHVLSQRNGRILLEADDLQAGDVVVTAGHHKLRDGVPVRINNSVRP